MNVTKFTARYGVRLGKEDTIMLHSCSRDRNKTGRLNFNQIRTKISLEKWNDRKSPLKMPGLQT